MKLRIHGNSLRLRLTQPEVAQFSKTGFVEDSVQFGPGIRFAYTIETSSALSTPQATYQDHWLRIQVPASLASEWYTSDDVAISAEQKVEPDATLAILIEKDYQCLHGGDKRDPNAFPNPLQETVAKP